MQRSWRRAGLIVAVVVLLAAGFMLRREIVATWHAPAGDGLQYYNLSQELLRSGSFAFLPGGPPVYTRMPGYPLFLAWLAVRTPAIDLQTHIVEATRANVPLDLATALLVFLLIRELRPRGGWSLLGLVLSLLCPMLVLLSCYALSETLATFLATLALTFGVRGMRRQLRLHAALAGGALGLALLVRFDAMTLLPALGLALLCAPASRRERLIAGGIGLGVCGLVFAPWPIRNLREFGAPHFAAYYWRTTDGRPLPMEPIGWTRTWASGAAGESFLDGTFAYGSPVEMAKPGVMLPWMWDSPAEHDRLVDVFNRYNAEGWTLAVRQGFAALARERARRAPLRTWVWLPMQRAVHLWTPLAEYELPMRVPWLGLPSCRPLFAVFDYALFALALVGALALLRGGRDARVRAGVLLLPIVVRTVLYSYTVALGITERYLVEIYPLLITLAVVGAASLFAGRGSAPGGGGGGEGAATSR